MPLPSNFNSGNGFLSANGTIIDATANGQDSNSNNFVIEELAPQGSQKASGSLKTKPLSKPIVWTAENYSKPRESWKIKKKLRTYRVDYSDKPTEQVLGIQYEPFTLSGVWDNKYNGGPVQDFAWTMKEAFEALQDRGNLCKFSFDSIHITGLITEFDIEYIKRSYIGYSFTVSPHFRENNATPRQAPKLFTNPSTYDQQLENKIQEMTTRHAAGPQAYMVQGAVALIRGYASIAQQKGRSMYDQGTQYINSLSISSQNISLIIANRLSNGALNQASGFAINNTTSNNTTGLQRLIQELGIINDTAVQLIEYLKSARSSAHLIYQNGEQIFNFQSWANSLKQLARQMIEISFNARQEYKLLVENDIIAIYRPKHKESFYDISEKFYGSSDMWRIIYTQNDIKSMILQGDELLIIPKVNS